MDYKALMPSILRGECVLRVLSLFPVLSYIRHGQITLKTAAERERLRSVPALGVPAAVFLLASELAGCCDLFIPLPKRKDKSRFDGLLSSTRSAFETVAKLAGGRKGFKTGKSTSMLSSVVGALQSVLMREDDFYAVSGLVSVSALMLLLGLVTQRCIGKDVGVRSKRGVLVLVVLTIFVVLHIDVLAKGFTVLAGAKIIGRLQLPLRIAGILCATRPTEAGGTPAMFAALQAASLAIKWSTLVASGAVGELSQELHVKPWSDVVFDREVFSVVVALFIGLLWLFVTHLRLDHPAALLLAAGLASLSTPPVISQAVPNLQRLGLPSDPESALSIVNAGLLMTVLATFFAGGPLWFCSGMLLLRILGSIHGFTLGPV